MYVTINSQIMAKNTTLSITEARKKIFKLANEVQEPDTYFVLTENGRPKAVLMSAEEFDSWKETLEVMAEIPNLKEEIEEAEKEIDRGEYVTLEELLEKEGLIVTDNGELKDAPNKNQQKGAKKS